MRNSPFAAGRSSSGTASISSAWAAGLYGATQAATPTASSRSSSSGASMNTSTASALITTNALSADISISRARSCRSASSPAYGASSILVTQDAARNTEIHVGEPVRSKT